MYPKLSIVKPIFCLLTLFLFATLEAKSTPSKTPEYIHYYNEGVVAMQNRDYEDAIISYKEAIALKKDFPDAWNNLGYCYRMVAKSYLVQAGEAYSNALEDDPAHEGALEYQGEYYLMLGELNRAYENYQVLKKMKSSEAKELKSSIDPILKEARTILKSYSP